MLRHYWVAFDCYVLERPDTYPIVVAPHCWVDAENDVEAQKLARRRLAATVNDSVICCLVVEYSHEEYLKELARRRHHYESNGLPVPN